MGVSVTRHHSNRSSTMEFVFGLAAAAVGLESVLLFLFGGRPFAFWGNVLFVSALVAVALAGALGAYRHAKQHAPGGLGLMWGATALAIVLVVWSALSPVLILLAGLMLTAALLGTRANVRHG